MKYSASLLLLLICGWYGSAYAQSSPGASEGPIARTRTTSLSAPISTDFIFLTGSFDQFSSGTSGRNGAIDWVRSTTKARAYSIGAAMFSVADGRWAYGKAVVAFPVGNKFLLQTETRIGSGRIAGAQFPYLALNSSVTYSASKYAYVRYSHQYLHINDSRGNVFAPGAILILARHSTVDVSFTLSPRAQLGTSFVTTRFDTSLRSLGFFAGVSLGHTIPAVLNLDVSGQTANQDLRDGFFGIRIPVSHAELHLASEISNWGAVRRYMTTVSLKLPFGGGEPHASK